MDTYEMKNKVLEYYGSTVSEDWDSYNINFTEISTEDGYAFYAIQYDRNGKDMEYYYSEGAAYEKIVDLIRDGSDIGNVYSENIEWEELYEEIVEEELAEKNQETRQEVLALLKPIAKTFLEDKIFTEDYSKVINTEQQNDYVNLLLDELKFDTSC